MAVLASRPGAATLMIPTPATPSLPPLSAEPYDVGATGDSLARMQRDFAAHGDTYRVYAPARRSETWVIHDPDDVKRVLLGNPANYTKGIGLDRVKVLVGDGLMVSEGATWKRQRRMMQPMFHRRVIERFRHVIDEANEAVIARWAELARRGESVDVTSETSELALGIMLRSIFGSDLAWLADRTGGNPFEVVSRMPERDLRFAYRFRSLSRLVHELLDRRRGQDGRHFDYLAMLMSARDKDSGEPMRTRDLIDEVMTLVVAGHETTAATLNMTWYLLSRHPEAETRLHRELNACPPVASPDFRDTEALAYTQMVLQEAMRLYPPGWLLTRRSIGPDRLGGYDLPAGTDVLLSPYLVHRHPRHWNAPEAFRPERFLPEECERRHKFAYFPFATGPRHCIGENFAMYEMTIHVAKVARRLRLRCLHEGPPEMEAQVNLRTRANLRFSVESR